MKYILVFGSLRRNSKRGYNFNRFGGQTYLKNVELCGFEMYDLGAYPAICPGKGKIQCELHSIEDGPLEAIRVMEKGAGYKEKELIVVNHTRNVVESSIFYMDKSRLINYPKVETGDWN